MKLLVVSDLESKFIWDHFDRSNFSDVGLILSCGDLSASYLSFLVTMLPCPLLYVPGNHDKRFVDEPPQGCMCIDGGAVVWHGLRIAGLGGCKSPRKLPYEYTDKQMWARVRRLERSIRRIGGLDILLTHAPAIGLGDGRDLFHEGFEAFRYLLETYHPQYHFYGHVHSNANPFNRRDFQSFESSTLVNATGYKLIEAPEPVPPAERKPLFVRSRSSSVL